MGGGTSYAISLPKQWIQTHGLRAGDEVLVEWRPDGGLAVRSKDERVPRPAARRFALPTSDPDEIVRSMTALYISGFDLLTLTHEAAWRESVRAALDEACRRLHGLQVVEEAPDRVVVQDLSAAGGLDVDRGFRRMEMLASRMLSNVSRLASNEDARLLAETGDHENELDRLLILLLKQHVASLRRNEFGPRDATPPHESLWYVLAAQFLERIGDYTMRVASFCSLPAQEPKPGGAQDLRKALAEARALVADAVRAFHSRDVASANNVVRAAAAFGAPGGEGGRFEAVALPREPRQLDSRHRWSDSFTLMECVHRIALYAKSLAEVAIDRAHSAA